MAVITISRQHGSGGHAVTKVLCERLGYRYFDKELMEHLGTRLGLAPDQVVDLPEDQHQVQSLMERVFANVPTPFGDPSSWTLHAELEAQQEVSVQTFQRLIRAAHEHSDVVIMGRGGQVVLHDAPDVLHVRLVAPLELRIQRVVQQNAGMTADAARERVSERDRASAEYVKRFYNVDVDDPMLYDLVINTSKLTVAATADLIIKALECLTASVRPKPSDVAA